MECRMRTRVKAMVEQRAREHQQELAAAGTLMDLEELTAQIGDACGRQLCENELTSRSGRAAKLEQCECPQCGLLCPRGDPEPVVLQGLRGEIAFPSGWRRVRPWRNWRKWPRNKGFPRHRGRFRT